MKASKRTEEAKAPFELIEEAFHLLRLAPASTLAAYYLGSLPFVLALLFFWSDMSRSAFAGQRLATGALVLSLLFFWMKTWQAIFAQELLARLSGEASRPWKYSHLLRAGVVQAIVQPSGLFLVPLAFLILVPFGWIYAFYQNVSALGNGEDRGLRQVLQRSWRQARLWPLQNHYLLFLLKFFGIFVFLNLITAVLAIPYLLSKFLAIDTAFSQSLSAALNTTFFASIFGLTYLCLDPILKTIYVLRCFYGESLQTGRDLKAEIKNVQSQQKLPALLASILLLGLTLPAECFGQAQDSASSETADPAQTSRAAMRPPHPGISAPALDRSIEETLRKREFTWRMPREKLRQVEESKKGVIATLLESVLDSLSDVLKTVAGWIEDFFRWLSKYLRPRSNTGASGTAWISAMYAFLWVIVGALVCALLFLLFRVWRTWRQPSTMLAEAIMPVPDVADENVAADQLPEDGWLKLARELLEKGELRLALRAFYLASLARLAQSNLITIARFKSNRDYERELQRRAHAFPAVTSTFAENVSIFDRVWYGLHEVNPELVAHFAGNVERIRT